MKLCQGLNFTMISPFGILDTYRNTHSLLTCPEPKIEGDIIQSLIDIKQGGWIPKWPNPGNSDVLIGAPATPVITEAYLKGITNFEVEKAYEGMKKNAWKNQIHKNSKMAWATATW